MIIVIIPAYNEEKNLVQLLPALEQILSDTEIPHQIIVVNDGSVDRTAEVLEEFSRTLPIEIIHHPENRNLGAAMRTGFNRALEISGDKDFIITMDADNSHPPREIINLYDRLLDGLDVVVASRYKKGGEERGVPRHRVLLSKGANWLFKLLFPIEGISDYTGSFRGIRAPALKSAWKEKGAETLEERGFTVMPEILLTLRKKGLRFAEIPLVLRYDLKSDASKMRILENIRGTLSLMARKFLRGPVGRKG